MATFKEWKSYFQLINGREPGQADIDAAAQNHEYDIPNVTNPVSAAAPTAPMTAADPTQPTQPVPMTAAQPAYQQVAYQPIARSATPAAPGNQALTFWQQHHALIVLSTLLTNLFLLLANGNEYTYIAYPGAGGGNIPVFLLFLVAAVSSALALGKLILGKTVSLECLIAGAGSFLAALIHIIILAVGQTGVVDILAIINLICSLALAVAALLPLLMRPLSAS